jgi:hypothetical protein
MLNEAFANGPLMGGNEDAFERLERLTRGDEVDVIEGVSCLSSRSKPSTCLTIDADARIKQMTMDLTASPGEIGEDHTAVQTNGYDLNHEDLRPEQEEAAAEAHEHLLHPQQQAPPAGLNFMQASELEQPGQSQAGTYDQAAEYQQPAPAEETAPAAPTGWAEQDQTNTAAPVAQAWTAANQDFSSQSQINSWADDVEHAQVVDAAPAPAEAPKEVATQAPAEPIAAEPAQPASRGCGRDRRKRRHQR